MQSVKSKNGRSDDTLSKNGKSIRPVDKIYRPTDREPFMNERQREYFRLKLLDWREDILKVAKETLQNLQDASHNHPHFADPPSSETDRAIELRAGERQRKLVAKIDAALQRIEDGAYGYCEDTGEPISLKRLEARPIATLSIEAQERHERRERVYRDERGGERPQPDCRRGFTRRVGKSEACPPQRRRWARRTEVGLARLRHSKC